MRERELTDFLCFGLELWRMRLMPVSWTQYLTFLWARETDLLCFLTTFLFRKPARERTPLRGC